MPGDEKQTHSYLKCLWLHNVRDDPVVLYSELDPERWETRKVEVFRDGSKGWADARNEVRSVLGEAPVPPLSEIAMDPQFQPREISAEEFESVWKRRMRRDLHPFSITADRLASTILAVLGALVVGLILRAFLQA
jgi:hypothetical protein